MGYSVITVPLNKIYLDNENPRHEPIDNESEIIKTLIKDEKVKKLASDIASSGSTSPLERMAAIHHSTAKNSFIAVEGNRRLCALKLLSDPDLAATEADKRYFNGLKNKLPSPITMLEVVLFDDRDDARHWIELRHEGEQDGVGTRSWDTNQKARFNRQGSNKSNPNILSSLLIEYALHRSLINQEEHDKISLTTLTRYLSNPLFRHIVGLVSNKDLEIDVPQDEFDTVIKRFLIDSITPNSGVSSRTDKADRESYARKLKKEETSPSNRLDEKVALNADTGKLIGGHKKNQPGRDNKSPDKRPNVIPADFKAHIKDPVLKRIYDELKKLDSHSFSFAAAYLFRAFIEQIAVKYLQSVGLAYEAELHVLIGRVAEDLKNKDVKDNALKPFRVMSNSKDSKHSPDTLGAFVHGSMIPTRAEINRAWDSIQPLLIKMLDELK
jgi:hypothetical protein